MDINNSYGHYHQRLTAYVQQNVVAEFDPTNDKLIDVLDSVGLLQLIMHIESDFNIVLDPASLSIEVFLDIDSLAKALNDHTAGREAPPRSNASPAAVLYGMAVSVSLAINDSQVLTVGYI